LKKEKGDTNAKSSRIIKQIKKKKFHLVKRKRSIKSFKEKKYSHIVVNQSNNNFKYYIEIKLLSKDNNKKEPKLNKIEKLYLLKKKSIKASQPTGH